MLRRVQNTTAAANQMDKCTYLHHLVVLVEQLLRMWLAPRQPVQQQYCAQTLLYLHLLLTAVGRLAAQLHWYLYQTP